MGIKLSKQRWAFIQPVLDEILELPEHEQLAQLKIRYGEDKRLVEEVSQLLDAESQAPDELEGLAIELAELDSSTSSSVAFTPSIQSIGPYRLCEEIGRGGMGVVYRAERNDGRFEQEVAIKLLNTANNHGDILERFEREQQYLASLQHTHIARIYDGSQTDDGQPYFIMEYIKGVPIDHYCEQNKLSIAQRLALIKQVIQALSFAHKNLIIHRDIKPSNLLVTDDSQVKLLDFGIAKWLHQDYQLEHTQTAAQMMTPAFAAPEQLNSQTATVQTDIYQLALVIYTLLTGHHAFQDDKLSYVELLKKKSSEEPGLPSTIVNHGQTPKDGFIASLSHKERKQWENSLKGDIDAILITALKSKPEFRYASMDALLQDVNAYFDKRPISVQHLGLYYRIRKFVWRNWKPLTIASVFIVLSISYMVTVTLQSQKIRHALLVSKQEQRKAQSVSNFMLNIFKAADPNVSGIEKITAHQLLNKGYDKILSDLGTTPDIQAHMLTQLGEIYFSQGHYEQSVTLLEQALATHRLEEIEDPLSLANTLTQLGVAYTNTKQLEKAEALFEESLLLHKKSMLNANSLASMEYAETNTTYGQLLRKLGQYEQAKAHFEKAIQILRDNPDYDRSELAVALNGLANLEASIGDYTASRKNMLEAIDIHREVLGTSHSYLSIYLNNLSILLTKMERFEEAEKYSEEALSIQRRVLPEDHPYFAATYRSRAMIEYHQNNLRPAKNLLTKALAINKNSLQSNNYITAILYEYLGFVSQDLKQLEEAEKYYQLMKETYEQLGAGKKVIARSLGRQASLAHSRGEHITAQKLYEQALSDIQTTTIKTSFINHGYAKLLFHLRDYPKAQEVTEQLLELRRENLGEEHSLTKQTQSLLDKIKRSTLPLDNSKTATYQ
ncbi:serine/threonine-protein kinase [Pleionea sp. CnH1-48]|uniref:serine/threonine-protein kinase n=1 Tax=Pleionea sp. CnH1-48 TaxID=2954494 RepID=UPI002096B9CA|nr:serine/threonine-protein kinase [Pleionea sp. CnH1-48]MCO7225491.1 serine/threonine-protein kinase [Pleionea sp. CnH1-48]